MLEQRHYAFNRPAEQPEPAAAAPPEQGTAVRLKTLRELALALSNAFGFGGHNAVLCLEVA